VTIHPPKTPVTKGSNAVAAATVPNVCKMPGPPAPFVPTPLPNIGRSGLSPQGFSKTVEIEGQPVAIRGASFGSQGDMASKGTGGGLISANTHGPTKFIGPGSLDVKIEGKNVHLLGDPTLNNCGPSGSPANAATIAGVIQMAGSASFVVAVEEGPCPLCEKTHEELAETEASHADASGLAARFHAKVADARGAVSTMLGVIHCRCGAKYAGQSSVATDELVAAAKECGMVSRPSSGASYRDSRKKREAGVEADAAKVMDDLRELLGEKHSELLADTLVKVKKLASQSWENRNAPSWPAAYPAGMCAAQSVLVLTSQSGGLPAAMTERWYSKTGSPTAGAVEHIDNRDGTRKVVIRVFEHGETVPPCKSCELIVPLFLCCEGEDACACKS